MCTCTINRMPPFPAEHPTLEMYKLHVYPQVVTAMQSVAGSTMATAARLCHVTNANHVQELVCVGNAILGGSKSWTLQDEKGLEDTL